MSTNIEQGIQLARNMFGTGLTPDCEQRLRAVLDSPTVENWDEAQSIILTSDAMGGTLWQAVVAVDPTFPRRGRATDMEGNVVREWERIPSTELLRQALAYATH